jgi:hypothetical protein
MCRILTFLGSLDWVAITALGVAIWSLYVGRKTLDDAEESWNQQKWFDLYAKADEAYDLFDWYCTVYSHSPQAQTPPQASDWNKLMYLIKRAHSMAMVFPQHPAIDKLVKATSNFISPADAFLPWRKPLFFEAVQDLRDLSKLDPSVLRIRKRTHGL